jgi:hypothetical protein
MNRRLIFGKDYLSCRLSVILSIFANCEDSKMFGFDPHLCFFVVRR